MERNRHENITLRREQDAENPPLEGGQAIAKAIRQMTEVLRNQMKQGYNARQGPPRGEQGYSYETFLVYRYISKLYENRRTTKAQQVALGLGKDVRYQWMHGGAKALVCGTYASRRS